MSTTSRVGVGLYLRTSDYQYRYYRQTDGPILPSQTKQRAPTLCTDAAAHRGRGAAAAGSLCHMEAGAYR